MCLGVPGKVVSVEGTVAIVDFWGVRRKVALDIVDEDVTVGDHVLVHVGFAIRRIAPEDLAETLAFFQAMTEGDLEGLAPRAPSPAEPT
jgi:hydrogenase expression/formation protein HypC